MTPASKIQSSVLAALNQAFVSHVHDEERRFEGIAKSLDLLVSLAPTLVRIEERQIAMGDKVDLLAKKTDLQNGRVGKLERWRSWTLGIFLISGAIAGYVLDHVIKATHP